MRENLFVVAQAYADANGLAMTTVSKRFHGNQFFLERFIRGQVSTTVRKYYEMLERFREEWPAGAKWPVTKETGRPTRVAPPAVPRAMPPRGPGGKFLGKKVHARRASA